MRTIIISFKPDVYENILNGTKIFEHRRRFPNEQLKAYLYISRPVCAITGILYLNNRHALVDWLSEYSYDKNAVERIQKKLLLYNYAMEMPKFIETSQIPLKELRENFDFLIPRSYYYIDKTPLLDYLNKNLIPTGKTIEHSKCYENVLSTQICIK